MVKVFKDDSEKPTEETYGGKNQHFQWKIDYLDHSKPEMHISNTVVCRLRKETPVAHFPSKAWHFDLKSLRASTKINISPSSCVKEIIGLQEW